MFYDHKRPRPEGFLSRIGLAVLTATVSAALAAASTYALTKYQEKTRAFEQRKIDVVADLFKASSSHNPAGADRKQPRLRALFVADEEAAKALAAIGDLGCYKQARSISEGREIFRACGAGLPDFINAFRSEVGLEKLPREILERALAWEDAIANIMPPEDRPVEELARPPPPPPPPPAAPPPPVSAPGAAPLSRMVFFDWDSSNLSSMALDRVRTAADAYKATPGARVIVVGYADTSGSDANNATLSLRRAQEVTAALAREGVPESVIVAAGAGAHGLLVPSGRGVREPHNRRAEILVLR